MSPPSTAIGIKSQLNSSVWRCVSSASESTARLKPGEGMASRGTMSLTMTDFEGDPGPINFSEDGTFFGKLKARNVLDGKKIITHYYTITPESETPVEVSASTHFIEKATLTKGKFSISAKDALKDLEAFSQQFPIPTEAKLTVDIDDVTTTIPVDDGSLFTAEDVIIIDKELMRIQSINVNNLTVYTRGSEYQAVDTTTIYKTNTNNHTIDSTVQICYVMSKTFLSNVLQDIFNAVGLSAYVDFTQWDDEISDWNENAFLYGVFHSPTEADELINHLLTDYMIDMWLDQPIQKAVVSATTAWKQSIRTITEENDLSDLRTSTSANTRFSRAYIYNKKDFQAENEDETNYSQLTLHKDITTESSDLYGSIKVKEFEPSNFITPDSAFILVSRYVQRFARTPEELSFKMEERKLANSRIGDVVDIVTRDSQTPSGEFLQARIRSQLIEIKPNLNGVGRMYDVKALSYVPLIASTPGGDLTIFISGTVFDVNLYARAGAPPEPLNVTFVFDECTIGSTANNVPSIRAGAFDAASVIKLIFTNSSKVSARGGDGGDASVTNSRFAGAATTTNATDGGDIYQSDGIESELYLNYGTVDTYVTDCEMYAAGGGGGSSAATTYVTDDPAGVSVGVATSGGGGSGIPSGSAGALSGFVGELESPPDIQTGQDGTFNGGGIGATATNFATQTIGTAPPVTATAQADSSSGDGRWGLDGGFSTATTTAIEGTKQTDFVSISNAGLAGGAIKGANVTVFNLAAEASKFRDGNSDSYVLITV